MYELQLDDGRSIMFDNEPNDRQIQDALKQANPPKSLAGKAVDVMKNMAPPWQPSQISQPIVDAMQGKGYPKDFSPKSLVHSVETGNSPLNPINPFQSGPMKQAQQTGDYVKQVSDNSLENVIKSRAPYTEAAIKMATPAITPDTAQQFIGADALLLPFGVASEALSGSKRAMSKAVMESIIPETSKEIQAGERIATHTGQEVKSPAQKVLDRPELGNTRADIKNNAHAGVQRIEGEIQAGLDAYKDVQVPKDEFLKVYDDMIEKYKKVPNSTKDVKMIERLKNDFLNQYPDSQSIPEWNEAKRGLYEKTGDAGYIAEKPSVQVRLDKALARKIATVIDDQVPGIKRLSREQGDLIDIRDSVIKSSPRDVRDVQSAITGHAKERAVIKTMRTLQKGSRTPFQGTGAAAFNGVDQSKE